MRRAVLVLVLALLTPGAGVARGAGPPLHYKEFAQGANVHFTNCPLSLPATSIVCHDYSVWYVRFDAVSDVGSVGPVDRSGAPFEALYEDDMYVLHPDGSADELAYQFGTNTDVRGSYDKAHLTSVRMDATVIQLNDVDLSTGTATPNGKTVALGPFSWVAASGIYTFGNNGPALGGTRHVSTDCETSNANAHQRFTLGYVTGTVDGISIATYNQYPQVDSLQPSGAPGAIFNNWFRIVDLTKRCP